MQGFSQPALDLLGGLPCGHGSLWLARDRQWYCEECSPPTAFELERGGVLQRQTLLEVLRLFEPELPAEKARRLSRKAAVASLAA